MDNTSNLYIIYNMCSIVVYNTVYHIYIMCYHKWIVVYIIEYFRETGCSRFSGCVTN